MDSASVLSVALANITRRPTSGKRRARSFLCHVQDNAAAAGTMDGMKETVFVLLWLLALKGLWSTLLLAGAAFHSIVSARQTNASQVSDNAWEGGSTQQITWTFKGAVPEVDIVLWSVCTWTNLLPWRYEVQYLEYLARDTSFVVSRTTARTSSPCRLDSCRASTTS